MTMTELTEDFAKETEDLYQTWKPKMEFYAKVVSGDPRLTVDIEAGENPSASINMDKLEIQISPYERQYEETLGMLFHEVGHAVFSKLLVTEEQALAEELTDWAVSHKIDMCDPPLSTVPRDSRMRLAKNELAKQKIDYLKIEKRIRESTDEQLNNIIYASQLRNSVHYQLNSFEDIRMERCMAQYYEQSDYYLWKKDVYTYEKYFLDKEIREFVQPQFLLHLYLKGINLTKFVSKDLRQAVKQSAKYLESVKFSECASTKDLLPHVEVVLKTLLPFMKPGQNAPKLSSSSGSNATRHPKIEVYTGQKIDSGEESKSKSGKTRGEKEVEAEASPESTEIKVERSPTKKKKLELPTAEVEFRREVKIEINYKKPPKPEVHHFSRHNVPKFEESVEGISQKSFSLQRGREIGRKLRKILQVQESESYHKRSGKLDIRALKREAVTYGKLTRSDVFSRMNRAKKDHSVIVLIDFSGSMRGYPLKRAKGAALMLASCLEELHVPYSIRGFSAHDNLNIIADYELKSFKDGAVNTSTLSKFSYAEEHCNNMDSHSIRLATKEILRYGKGEKIIFVISDGRPATSYPGYRGVEYSDTMNAVESAEKQGVKVVGIAITEEAKEFVKKVYRRGIWVNEIKELPKKLLNVYIKTTNEIWHS